MLLLTLNPYCLSPLPPLPQSNTVAASASIRGARRAGEGVKACEAFDGAEGVDPALAGDKFGTVARIV
jgi:hypothetical protein